jgi:DNA repair exonuclease SbcCD ATPase subunit
MGTLKALGEFVAQKSAALEAHREAVEVALARADALERAMKQVDAGVQQQHQNEKSLAALDEHVAGLRALHESVLERSREIAQIQREADEHARATRQDLASVRDEMKTTVERFDFESRGLESVTQRVTDLRGALSEFEGRFNGLSESSHSVGELVTRAQGLAGQLQTLADETARIDAEAEKLHALRRELDEMALTARETSGLVARIEQARPAVEAAVRDLSQLGMAGASVTDALEQTQLAHAEIVRVRESQSETRSWLTGVEQFVAELSGQVGDLRQLAPTVEVVQKQAQRIDEAMVAIEERRALVEGLQQKVADLGTQSGTLDERSRELQTRMDSAEQRFVGLAQQADEAQRMTDVVGAVSASVVGSKRTADELRKTVAAVQARCESVEGLAERTATLGQELEQRHQALGAATRDLQKASGLRAEAAASAQQLDDLTRRLAGDLGAAEKRAASIDKISAQLEDRGFKLQGVDKRLVRFEERLARWELVEQEVSRSLEHLVARQSTVESLQADLERMFVMSEQTATNVRTITSAQREVEEGRKRLDEVRERMRDIEETTSALDERKRQMTQAEERLARAGALIVDVRSSLEALEEQRAIVDQAVEKAGSLQFLLKQAEATIEGLREERRMGGRIRAAGAGVREHEDTDEAAEAGRAA